MKPITNRELAEWVEANPQDCTNLCFKEVGPIRNLGFNLWLYTHRRTENPTGPYIHLPLNDEQTSAWLLSNVCRSSELSGYQEFKLSLLSRREPAPITTEEVYLWADNNKALICFDACNCRYSIIKLIGGSISEGVPLLRGQETIPGWVFYGLSELTSTPVETIKAEIYAARIKNDYPRSFHQE